MTKQGPLRGQRCCYFMDGRMHLGAGTRLRIIFIKRDGERSFLIYADRDQRDSYERTRRDLVEVSRSLKMRLIWPMHSISIDSPSLDTIGARVQRTPWPLF